jgi:hypothetical protein
MSMFTWQRARRSDRRGVRMTRARFALECLEERTVLSHVAEVPGVHAGIAEVAKAAKKSPVSVTSVVINDVALSGDQLIANGTLNATVKGHAISLPLTIPVSLTPASSAAVTPAAATPVQVLNLSLGAVNLSLLGLNVHLGGSNNFGDTTPITAQIVAIPTGATYTSGGTTYTGGLLGDVLSDVANLLNSGGSLSGLGSSLSTLETNLTSLLNQTLGGLNSGNSSASMLSTASKSAKAKAVTHAMAVHHASALPMAAGGATELVDLHLSPITLDLLGAFVHTSDIYLNITATRGPGNLLGNLLAGV